MIFSEPETLTEEVDAEEQSEEDSLRIGEEEQGEKEEGGEVEAEAEEGFFEKEDEIENINIKLSQIS